MKDLYSFHADENDLDVYYEKAKQAYFNVFQRCGLDAKLVEASGGSFSKFSHEYQVLTENGEDIIKYCDSCDFAQNQEICALQEGDSCPVCGAPIKVGKAIEVGNIFKLKTKYSAPFNFVYKDKDGSDKDVIMGCYGIGPSRVLGSIVEVHHDEKGIIWPKQVAPFLVHLILISKDDKIIEAANKLHKKLIKEGIEVLFDDREESAGVKLADADLLGLPYRLIVSDKTAGKVELKKRHAKDTELVNEKEAIEEITNSKV
jgi:prolyl-tRNA synthetase